NVGGALIPIIGGLLAEYYGWRYGFYIPGIFCIFGGFFLLLRLADTPRSLGLPKIEEYKNEMPKSEAKEVEKTISAKELLFKYVLKNKYMWILGFAAFFVYIIRTAINDWTITFLVKEKGISMVSAGIGLFWFEMGGFLGSLFAGWSSDYFFNGRRGPINVAFSFLSAFAVLGLYFAPSGHLILHYLALFVIGFFIFGPQMLIGMAAAELSHVNAAGASTGFVSGWFGYLGAAFAGYPIGLITEIYGWQGFFVVMCVSGVIATLFLLPLWSLNHKPKEE
ncbi:MAG: hypothetical protein K940chlam8_01240, partial [Chlamydiae bacterium]|nr:hypothetical protein [Chlamydiota bacterium]